MQNTQRLNFPKTHSVCKVSDIKTQLKEKDRVCECVCEVRKLINMVLED